MKVHWWTYNHCLFVSYLTSVAFGYGCISDTTFQNFLGQGLDMDIQKIYHIWIKSRGRTGSGLPESTPAGFYVFFGPGSGVKNL